MHDDQLFLLKFNIGIILLQNFYLNKLFKLIVIEIIQFLISPLS